MAADSEFINALMSTDEIILTAKSRKSGRNSSRPVWFVLEGRKLYVVPVTGSDSEWYKNVLADSEVQISAKGRKLTAKAKPIQDSAEVMDVVQKFRAKYGATEIAKYYSKLDAAVEAALQ